MIGLRKRKPPKPMVGVIVGRWSEHRPIPILLIGQVIEADGKRYSVRVDAGKPLETWHAATIACTFADLTAAARYSRSQATLMKAHTLMVEMGVHEPLANAVTNESLTRLARGDWA